MPFEEYTERANPRIGDASVMLRVRKTDGRPGLIVSILKSFMDANRVPLGAQDRIDVLVGKDEAAGKIRLRKTKTNGVGVMKTFRGGAMSVDCGYIAALGEEGRGKLRVKARVVDGCVEIDLPNDEDWKNAEGGPGQDSADEPVEEADEEAPQANGADDHADDAEEENELRLGISLVGGNGIAMHGRKLKLPGMIPNLIAALAKVAPDTLPTNKLADIVWSGRVPEGALVILPKMVATANDFLIDGDLKIKAVGKMGFALSRA